MPPKAKKSKKEIEEEKSKWRESPILHDLQSLCWMLTKDIEKLEEEKRIQEELERKRQEKMDMEDAARYIQRKWKWYQEVGKFLAKKKKKGKKGGKKKKW